MPRINLADIDWAHDLPTEEGYYFIWNTGGYCGGIRKATPEFVKVIQLFKPYQCEKCRTGKQALIYRFLDTSTSFQKEGRMFEPSEDVWWAGPYKYPDRICDECGERFEDEYAWEGDLHMLQNSAIYCSDCCWKHKNA